MKIIQIAGQAGVGKTTLARILAKESFELGYIPVLTSFAGPLKREAESLGYSKQMKPEEYRRFCQEQGALMRKEDPDYWVNQFEEELHDVARDEEADLTQGKTYWERCVIIDDCRYSNELALGIKYEAIMVFLSYGKREMPDTYGEWRNHHSETLAKLIDEGPSKHRGLFNALIKNQGTIEDLEEKVIPLLKTWIAPCDSVATNIERYDEHEEDLNKCVTELIDLLLLGKVEVDLDDEPEEDEEEWFEDET